MDGVMKRRLIAGTTLIELLVVIVVFLVGILAFVQIFPAGLGSLRTSRTMTVARLLARSETQNLAGKSKQLPEFIGATQFVGGGAFQVIDPTVNPNELMPPLNNVALNEGRITLGGQVLVGGSPVGDWMKVSGANRMTRVIGEGRPVGAPVATAYFGVGSLMQLTFGPMYYSRDPGTGVGTPGLVSGYSNDFSLRLGDRDAGFPDPANSPYEPWTVHFVSADKATVVGSSPFLNQEQLWFNLINDGTLYRHDYRIKFTFYYDFGGTVRPVDAVVNVPGNAVSAFYDEDSATPRYGIISLPELMTLTGGIYTVANYRGAVVDSIRFQRLYREVSFFSGFSDDPLEYMVINNNLGMIMLNPAASGYKLESDSDGERPMSFRCDYTVFDWRIMRDEFTVPATNASSTFDVKLLLDSIKPLDSLMADSRPWAGLGTGWAGTTLDTPNSGGTVVPQDFVLIDMATGGVVLGNSNTDPASAYFVDKSRGYINFRDTDGNAANGITGTLLFLDPSSPTAWVSDPNVQLNGRRMRALYVGRGDMALQMLKAASSYDIVTPTAPVTLGAAQVYAGGTGGWGSNDRLYFPVMDLGQRVTVGELKEAGVDVPRREQQYAIDRVESVGGVNFAVAVVPFVIDNNPNVVPMRRVKGSSLKVRVVWNPGTFSLNGDEIQNFGKMKTWANDWRRVETTTFLGAN